MAKELFFKPLMNMTKSSRLLDEFASTDNDVYPVCKSRKMLIPNKAQAQNIAGKWMYLLENSAGEVQNVEVSTYRDII